ncbi:Sodium/calcium exchanger protein [Coniochaeta hoffmannii]|uniref:Sodium/calcium exchanger protein n=1 Tax=Coniochaeta hoffmannii TaxID=91930 RepID=A0AA38RZ44_9PEZI|nr:Sodium/calcium exchanger protein [Coniochaeta hoffmannii]
MPAASSAKRPKYSVRPFFISTFIITVLATYALFIRGPPIPHTSSHAPYLGPRSKAPEPECNTVRDAKDQCAFVLRYCDDDEAGLIQYLTFYYCTMGSAKPVAFILMVIWLGLLFSTIGIAASDFFSVNLSTIASILGLSESLAGVTFLAFGNGSPDVFSTFAAMGSNSGSMAVGELIGAAGFITAVVAGSMALVREFKVSKRTFIRDICFFIVAVGFAIGFLADGSLKLWECLTMIGFYLFYVVTVVGWHWIATRRKQKRVKDSTARSHVYAPAAHGADELEPYRDEEDEDDTAPVGGRSRSAPEAIDISALERAPLIEVDDASPLDEDDERGVHLAAEMTSSMRVNRPRWGRSNTTITPIRPSLVGALEFRSVLASLQRARNMHLTPLPPRDYFDTPHGASSSVDDLQARGSRGASHATVPSATRDRALSSGHMPLNLESVQLPRPNFVVNTSSPPDSPDGQHPIRPIAGVLQQSGDQGLVQTPPQLEGASRDSKGSNLQLQIPSPSGRSSGNSSPSLSPFPGLSESPLPMSPNPQAQPSSFIPTTPGGRRSSHAMQIDEPEDNPRPVKWWPYKVLPPPHILLGTLFPTLQGWSEKTIWDKIVSAASVPSIFLLVVTLPVVETDSEDPELDLADLPEPTVSGPGNAPAPVSVDDDAAIEPETVWQHYRRRTRSVNSRLSTSFSPSIPALNLDQAPPSPEPQATNGNRADPVNFSSLPEPAKPTATTLQRPSSISPSSQPDTPEWHRWLVILQLFTGPLFVALILWANMYEDLPNPARTFVRLTLYSLLGSVVALGILLLTTSPSKKPRYHSLLCFLGFIISIAWISTVAGEVVGVLKALGVILGISEAILGLTVFAVGNSLGDLVADVTVARLGYPVMALAACFGGPMLNILLGVGIGGAWMIIKTANEKHRKHPERPTVYKPYKIEVGETLLISAITVLITLVALLVVVPLNKWVMSRRIGWGLIAIWAAGTVVNVVVEVTGPWSDVA